jgi:signal transduction histidine kinase
MNRYSLRTRLTILVTALAVITLAGLTAGFNLMLRSNLHADANRVLQGRASAALEAVSVDGGSIRVKESPDSAVPDSQVWVFSGGRALERAPAPPSVQRLADSLAGGPKAHAEDPSSDLRLYAVPVVQGGQRAGTVVAGISLEAYEHSASRALVASLIYAGAALLLVILATRLVVNRALRPVARMATEAADWSEHDLDHRFNVGEPHDELTRLAATFDSMLERLASSLRHEQLFSAELSHELRTPLAAMLTEAELALRRHRDGEEYRQALREIASRASQMETTLETLMAAARVESLEEMGTAQAEEVGEQAIAACENVARDSGVRLRLDAPDDSLRVDVDAGTAERILVPLIENGCRYGRSRVEVSIRPNGDSVEFTVEDDGPGLAASESERIFEPGFRGGAGVAADHRGAGLGLALARRLARAVGGNVETVQNGAGASFRARIPLARTGEPVVTRAGQRNTPVWPSE